MRRRFELPDASASFWEIELRGTVLTTSMGQGHSVEQRESQEFASYPDAMVECLVLITEKSVQGFVEAARTWDIPESSLYSVPSFDPLLGFFAQALADEVESNGFSVVVDDVIEHLGEALDNPELANAGLTVVLRSANGGLLIRATGALAHSVEAAITIDGGYCYPHVVTDGPNERDLQINWPLQADTALILSFEAFAEQ